MTSIKILKFAKDRVIMGAYDNSRDTASEMQLKTCYGIDTKELGLLAKAITRRKI